MPHTLVETNDTKDTNVAQNISLKSEQNAGYCEYKESTVLRELLSDDDESL